MNDYVMVALVNYSWYIIIPVFIIYLIVSYFLLRQKEQLLSSREEIYRAIGNKVYQRNTKKIEIVAGEANIEIHEKLCKIIRDNLESKVLQTATLTIGPVMSSWENNKQFLNDNGFIKEEFHNAEVTRKLHPIFGLFLDYPENISIYYKKETASESNINEPHFVLTDSLIYVEEYHEPLAEKKALIVEKPNYFMRKRYNEKISRIKNDPNVLKINKEDDIYNQVKIGYFCARPQMRTDV